MHIRHLLYYSSCQLFTNFQFFCVDWKLKQIAWVGAAYDVTSTSEHLFPAVSEEGGDCGVAMVTRILPDPPAAKDLLFFWTHWLWRHLARASLGVYDLNLIFVLHVFSDYPFLGFHESEWQLQHWIPDKAPSGAGYACLPLEFIEEMSCSTHCQEITFLKNASFFSWDLSELHLFPHVQSRWVHAPISCHCCPGRRLPTDLLLAVSWQWIAVCLLGADCLSRAKPHLRAATFHSHTAADGIVQAKLPIAVCYRPYKRSWGPGGASLFIRVYSTCREAGDSLGRWNQSSQEWEAGLKADILPP